MTKKNILIAMAATGILWALGGSGMTAKAAPPAEGNWTLLLPHRMNLMEMSWTVQSGITVSGMM